jgi:glyoxylase I family protein
MTVPFKTNRIHHVAYRCKDAKATVEWYQRVFEIHLYTTAFAEDHVPSTGEYDPVYAHLPRLPAAAMCSPFSNCPTRRRNGS